MSLDCERSCSSARRVSNFNSRVTQGGIYLHIKFEIDRMNIFRVRVLTSSRRTRTQRGSRRGRDAKNTSFGDIIMY